MSLVVDYCAVLRAEAAEVVKASEMLQGEVCGPADSMRMGNAHGEVNALLERIKGHWAQLPRRRPDSKPHQALVDKIHVESAAYLKIADAARGAERKADARDDVPAHWTVALLVSPQACSWRNEATNSWAFAHVPRLAHAWRCTRAHAATSSRKMP